jgi:hypothetical protein
LRRAREMFKQEVEKELTGRETEPWEIIYVKLYQSQLPVIERAIETACLMLGSDRSRGYCLEMICAAFLAGANLDHGDPEMLLFSMTRFFKFLPEKQRQTFLEGLSEKAILRAAVKKMNVMNAGCGVLQGTNSPDRSRCRAIVFNGALKP